MRSEHSTHLLGSLVHWESAEPGLYRVRGAGADAHLRSAGEDRSRWWFLPLVSYARSAEAGTKELMLWPLLGLGFGSEQGERYVRLFYFWKIGGRDDDDGAENGRL